MCYSAQIWVDFRKYERFGGKLNTKEFTKLAGWTKQKGSWVKVVPKPIDGDQRAGTLICETPQAGIGQNGALVQRRSN